MAVKASKTKDQGRETECREWTDDREYSDRCGDKGGG
jgi:hypothetical protein